MSSQLDNLEHHTYAGLRLIDQEKYSDAQREFELAIQLAAKSSTVYTGTALVKIYAANFDAVWDNLKAGWKYAKTNDEKIFVYVSHIQYYT